MSSGYRTHWKDCRRYVSHHKCCVAMVEKLRRDKTALVGRIDRLNCDIDEWKSQYDHQQKRACDAETEVQELQATIDNLHDELASVREDKDLRIAELEGALRIVQYATVDGTCGYCAYCGEISCNGCSDSCVIASALQL